MAISHITAPSTPPTPTRSLQTTWLPYETSPPHQRQRQRNRRHRPWPRRRRRRRLRRPSGAFAPVQPTPCVYPPHLQLPVDQPSIKRPNSYSPSCTSAASSLLVRLTLSVVCFAMLCSYPATVRADCPRQCECKWKSGKESVQCLRANLTGLPPFLDAGTQILDLTGNDIAAIEADAFTHANLLNLQRLFLAKCRIRRIERFGFRKIKNLVELDLSYNQLVAVPTHAFDSTPELRELRLTGNPIQSLDADAFAGVPQLIRLELTDCRLEHIDGAAFAGLEAALEWLRLDRNRLAGVRSEALTRLRNLHGLELAGNAWNCSCTLRPLRQWMLRENIPYDVPPVCALPQRLAARAWDKLELDDFACVPRIEAGLPVVQAVEGDNVTIQCRVRAVPEPQVHWLHGGSGGVGSGGGQRLLANLSAEAAQLSVVQGRRVFIARWWPDESNLTIVRAELLDAGVYNCTAANSAGRAEASVRVLIARRPPDALIGVRVLLTSVAGAVVVVVSVALLVVFVCSARKGGRKLLGWKKRRRRTESCENIEMTFNAGGGGGKQRGLLENGAGPKPYGENGISVVGGGVGVGGQLQKNRYCSVPSDDEGSLYEEAAATAAAGGGAIGLSVGGGSSGASTDATGARHAQQQQPDVHVPRLIDFCDQMPTSANASSLDGCPFDPNKSEYTSPTKTPILLYTKPNWTQQQQQHQHAADPGGPANDNSVYASSYDRRPNAQQRSASKFQHRHGHGDTDNSTYPDLLDISSLSLNAKHRQHAAPAVTAASSAYAVDPAAAAEPPFSTYPRQKPSPARSHSAALAAAAAAVSSQFNDSQQYLLSANSNQHLLSNSSVNMKLPPVPPQRHSVYHQRSSSAHIAHVAPATAAATVAIADDNHSHPTRSNVSLLSALMTNNNPAGSSAPDAASSSLSPSSSPSSGSGATSSTAANATSIQATAQAYDYHAAQLERFLEEYRNLQQQLCRMKETCDSIRQKEAPTVVGANGQRLQAQAAASAAAVSASAALLTMDGEIGVSPSHQRQRKGTTAVSPRQQPDPPPYWLHRTAMLKRLQSATTTAGSAGVAATGAADVPDNGNGANEYCRPQS